MGISGMQPSSPLTDEQKKTVQDILSNYDADNITATDAQSIFEKFKDAGITPTKGLKEAIESAGFDADNLRSLAFQGAQNATGGMSGVSGFSSQASELTDEQKETVASILSKYDKDNLTAADAQSIFKELKDAGITPQKGLKEAIESAGFDSEKLRSLARPQNENQENYFWASQSQSSTSGVDTSALLTLQTILNQYDLASLTSDQQSSLFSQLKTTGLFQSGSLLNMGA
jgi:hypothetical protein